MSKAWKLVSSCGSHPNTQNIILAKDDFPTVFSLEVIRILSLFNRKCRPSFREFDRRYIFSNFNLFMLFLS